MTRPRFEVADVLNRHGAAFVRSHRRIVTARLAVVLTRLQQCRTAALGGHRTRCGACAHEEISYNSCRDRHCPKCGASQRSKWVEAQTEHVLPVPYFHIVFTMPHELGPLALQNQRLMYGLLFRAASGTLLELAANPKHLGARIGVTAVLHTWGQNLEHHPHVHCVVTGGGLSHDAATWVRGRRRFFIHVRVMRALFRGKLLAYVADAYRRGELELHGRLETWRQPKIFFGQLKRLRKKKWVVYAKPPFGGPKRVLKYLGRYTHRVAIANRRLLHVDHLGVSFRWHDYRDGRDKVMRLHGAEFLRRFSLHVLPKGFVRIRHYGCMANCNRAATLKRCRELLGERRLDEPATEVDAQQQPDVPQCPKCGATTLGARVQIDPSHHDITVFVIWCDTS